MGWLRASLGVAVAVALLAACAREDGRKLFPGDALEPVEGVWFRVTDENAFGPGQDFAFIEVPLINVSETPITIRRVDALVDPETARVAEVTGIELAPRPRGERAYVRSASITGCRRGQRPRAASARASCRREATRSTPSTPSEARSS